MAKKYYAVKKGKTPGVYETWDECKEQVHGYPGAIYKSFPTPLEAMVFAGITDTQETQIVDESSQVEAKQVHTDVEKDTAIAYVDGSYEHSQKRYAYGCVILYQGRTTELSGAETTPELVSMRNVAGEIRGSEEAVAWAIHNGAKKVVIYHDYEGISRWANGEWKANKPGTVAYREFMISSRSRIEIDFVKVAAHTGVELNERADRLAKSALGL